MHSKEVLAEFAYKLNETRGFNIDRILWSDPYCGFLYDNSLPSKFMESLEKKNIISEGMDKIVCVLADWKEAGSEGIIFTDRAIYVDSPKNSLKKFKVRYDDILKLDYYKSAYGPEVSIDTDQRIYPISNKLWSKRSIYDFLQFATQKYEFDIQDKKEINNISLQTVGGADIGAIAAGITFGNVSNASSMYFDDKIVSPRGHGFSAEHANHLYDTYHGKDAQIVGNNNALNGPDRIVDGVLIQSKYCASGSRCIQECFRDGKFRYWNSDGSPMQIEVPSDMYDGAVTAMENRIKNGQVAGVTDPAEAKNIVRKGHFTYAQARNIAKAGTVESIMYDAASGAIIAKNAFGISAVLTFATELWNGTDFDVALKSATVQGLEVGGTTFITAVLAGQLSKAGLNSALVGSSEAFANLLGPRASAMIVNALRSGQNIYGAAAMKSLAKLLRNNFITGTVSFAVLSIGDVGNIFMGRISGGQLFKNLTETATSIAGGTAGWVGGAGVGTKVGAAIGTVVPVVGNAAGAAAGAVIGGIIGALGGGFVSSKAARTFVDQFIEDDAVKMVSIIIDVFTKLAEEYLISEDEAKRITDKLQSKLTGSLLKDMYGSFDRYDFARNLMEGYFEDVASHREYVSLPTDEQMIDSLKDVLEEMANKAETANI